MRRRTVIGATAVIATAAAGVTVLLLGTTATGSPAGGELAQISNAGDAVQLGSGQQQELQNVGAFAASRMATRTGRVFYRLLRPDGTVCYAVDTVGGDHVGNTSCPTPATAFPTSSNPVLDFTIFESTSHVPGDVHVVSAQGFAADGVKTVALLDRGGRLVAREGVVRNVYTADVLAGRVATTVVAYDAKHTEIFRVP